MWENRVFLELVEDIEWVRVLVNYFVEGNVFCFFCVGESMVVVYDWVGLLSLFLENFILYLWLGRCVDFVEDVVVVDGILFYMEISKDFIFMFLLECGVNFKRFGFEEFLVFFEVYILSFFFLVDDYDFIIDLVVFFFFEVVMIGDERYEIEILYLFML